jgi:hypothetical protein
VKNPLTVSSTFANRYKPTRRPKFAKELETIHAKKKCEAFTNTFKNK